MAGISAAQTLAIQQQISFTRDNETEADRVGLGILARSGFDPQGMPDFFETMSRVPRCGRNQHSGNAAHASGDEHAYRRNQGARGAVSM